MSIVRSSKIFLRIVSIYLVFFIGLRGVAATGDREITTLSVSQHSQQNLFKDGLNLFKRGAFEQSANILESAVIGCQAAGNYNGAIKAQIVLGEAYQALGNYKLAVRVLEDGLTTADRIGNTIAVKRLKSSLGAACLYTRDAGKAKSYLEESLVLAEADKDYATAAAILNNLGNLLSSQRRYQEASDIYRSSYENAVKSSNRLQIAKCRVNMASSAARNSAADNALALVAQAHDDVAILDDSHDKAYLAIVVGSAYLEVLEREPDQRNDVVPRIHASYRLALDVAERIGDRRALTYALGNMGHLYEIEDRFDDALSFTRKAAFIAQELQLNDALYRWQWQTGRILRDHGQQSDAITSLRNAIDTLQAIRHDIAIGYGNSNRRLSFRKTVGDVYFDLADLLFRKADGLDDPAEIRATLVEARGTIERLKSAELDDYFQDDCVNLARRSVKEIDSIEKKSAVIYIIPLTDRIELLISLPSGLRRFTTNIKAVELTATVRKFRRLLGRRTSHKYIPSAKALYDWLIRPLEPALIEDQIETLVFVPDGALLTIPMAALFDGKQFLIHKYSTAVIPGLTLMDPRPIESANIQILKCGLSKSVQGFPALSFVPQELDGIQALFEDGVVLQDREFNDANLTRAFSDSKYSIVHIATHGQFSSNAKDTFLLTYSEKLNLNRLESLIRPNEFRGQPVELLTLSACQTAAGDDRAALGLAGVAFKAGARSVMATLWFVSDEASSILISEFYRQLRDNPTISKVKALQNSQIALINDLRFLHPCYWSPYLIIGNWL